MIVPMLGLAGTATLRGCEKAANKQYHHRCLGLGARSSSVGDKGSSCEVRLTLAYKQVNRGGMLQLEHATVYPCVTHSAGLSFGSYKWKTGINNRDLPLGHAMKWKGDHQSTQAGPPVHAQ